MKIYFTLHKHKMYFTFLTILSVFINVMSSWNINNNQLILEGLIGAMPQLTERNQQSVDYLF